MNGRPIEDIKEKIADCASLLAKKGIDFFNPFSEAIAMDNAVDGVVEAHDGVLVLDAHLELHGDHRHAGARHRIHVIHAGDARQHLLGRPGHQ